MNYIISLIDKCRNYLDEICFYYQEFGVTKKLEALYYLSTLLSSFLKFLKFILCICILINGFSCMSVTSRDYGIKVFPVLLSLVLAIYLLGFCGHLFCRMLGYKSIQGTPFSYFIESVRGCNCIILSGYFYLLFSMILIIHENPRVFSMLIGIYICDFCINKWIGRIQCFYDFATGRICWESRGLRSKTGIK